MITKEEGLSIVRKWQGKLRLSHWTLGISTKKPELTGAAAEIHVMPTKQHAAIRIANKTWKLPEKQFEKTIIHECLHPIFEQILIEHERSCPREDQKYMRDVVETAVEHLTKVLYNLNNQSPYGEKEITGDF